MNRGPLKSYAGATACETLATQCAQKVCMYSIYCLCMDDRSYPSLVQHCALRTVTRDSLVSTRSQTHQHP